MSTRDKKLDDEMLVTHAQGPEPGKAGREDSGQRSPGVARLDRTQLRRELAAASTEEERRSIIQSIQRRFGNDVADELVRETRLARSTEGTEGETSS